MALVVTLAKMQVDRLTILGTVKEDVPQFQIWAQLDEQRKAVVGYVGTNPGAPVNIIVPDLPTNVVDEIKSQVEKLLKTPAKEMAIAPTQAQLAELNPPTDPVEDELVEDEFDDDTEPNTLS